MLTRSLTHEALKALKNYPAVVILGARQVGKTTLAKVMAQGGKRAWAYLDLESPRDVVRLSDPETYLEDQRGKMVVLDEVQRMPELFAVLRSVIDRDRKVGRFLLLGSSSPDVVQRTSESLAGRVAYLELMPFQLQEVGTGKLDKLWLRGGYPELFLARSNAVAFDRAEQYIRTIVERDLPQLGLGADPRITSQLLRMVASVHGQVLNASLLAKSLGITVHTVQRYLSFFEQAYLITLLPSYHTNLRKRLVKAPKIFVLDTGILHGLLGVESKHDLMGHFAKGHSWEGFVIQQVRARYGKKVALHYFRTQDGSELDLLISRGTKLVAAVEIKTSNAPTLSKGNKLAFEAVRATKQLICTPSASDFRISKGIEVCSIATIFQHLDKAIGRI